MIYLDYNATTPIAPDVRVAMLPFLETQYGNPSSRHALGQAGRDAVQQARQRVAALLGAGAHEIVFTSGGTESNNLALKGIFLPPQPKPGHLIITALEHPAIIAPARFLKRCGCSVTVISPDPTGVVDPAAIEAALRPETRLVSVMHANNEIGSIQPLRQIADLCRARGVLVHTDAAQSVGKIWTRVDELGVDMLTVAGHKLYAPKGVGALYVRNGVVLEPLLHGAGHERGVRAGTENVAYVVGLGAAAALALERLPDVALRMQDLRDKLAGRLQSELGPEAIVHGAAAARLPNTLSISFPGVYGGDVLERACLVAASTGAACHSGETRMSATLAAIGCSPELARGTIRLSLGWSTTSEETEHAAEMLIAAWRACRGKQGNV